MADLTEASGQAVFVRVDLETNNVIHSQCALETSGAHPQKSPGHVDYELLWCKHIRSKGNSVANWVLQQIGEHIPLKDGPN